MPNMPAPDDEDAQVGRAAVPVEHHPRRQQRVRGARHPERERGEQHHANREEAPGRRGGPVVRRGVGEPVDQAEHPGGDQDDTRHVKPCPGTLGCLCSRIKPPMIAAPAKIRLMYRHQRQDRYEVSAPPSSSPTAPPPAATEP